MALFIDDHNIPVFADSNIIVCSKNLGLDRTYVNWGLGILNLNNGRWSKLPTQFDCKTIECPTAATKLNNGWEVLVSIGKLTKTRYVYKALKMDYDKDLNLIGKRYLFKSPCMFWTVTETYSVFGKKNKRPFCKHTAVLYIVGNHTFKRFELKSEAKGIKRVARDCIAFSFAEVDYEESYTLNLVTGELHLILVKFENVYKPSMYGNKIAYCKNLGGLEKRAIIITEGYDLIPLGNIYQNKNLLNDT